MRIFVAIAAAVIALLAVDIQPGAAQNTTRPYCMRGGNFGPGTWDCSYYSMQQCLASASGLNGICGPNPFYRGPQNKAKRRQS
jgi:Protein of unknown function (DUF3551)